MTLPTIALASDHAGLELKNELKEYIIDMGYTVEDFGTHSIDSVDYPSYGKIVANEVVSGNYDLGILVCGTGLGIGITANKVKGVRCAIVSEPYSAMLSRQHNNANVIAIGARVVGSGIAKLIIKTWLEAEFEEDRHARRVSMIEEI